MDETEVYPPDATAAQVAEQDVADAAHVIHAAARTALADFETDHEMATAAAVAVLRAAAEQNLQLGVPGRRVGR